ncbi:hypothetical protein BDZ97DRAFT_112138 [Flammula alnicola]|nr:hypothetical protein BDZ97DRAFT_112138 [Flammula alnicola]
MNDLNRLPASFRSLYRLFLRTSSAVVLHHPRASRNLRRRWRPVFDEAAKVTREVQHDSYSSERSKDRVEWLKTWHSRMDNTLEFLYTASQSRGIPHQAARTLAYMIGNERQHAITKVLSRREWQPADPKPLTLKQIKNAEKKQDSERFKENSLGALDEVVRMAEASGNLILGRNKAALGRYVRRRSRR